MIDPTHKVTRDELHHATGRDPQASNLRRALQYFD